MSKITSTIFAIMLVGAFPALSMYTWSNTPRFTQDNSVFLATQFLHNMPTYAFDGMADTVKMINVEPLRMPYTWEVTFEFTSSHGGYGDRTGQIVTMVLTTHQTKIVVSEGKIIRAITDEVYDEINDTMLSNDDTQTEGNSFLTPESARDMIIGYILTTYPQTSSLTLPEQWVFEDATPEGLLGSSTFIYSGMGWTITVKFNIVLEPVYTVIVEYEGDNGFTWEGTVDQSLTVTETGTSLEPLTKIISPEEARDLAIKQAFESFSELKGMTIPTEWNSEDLTPEGLLGYSTTRFTSGDWTVDVAGPVVLHPTYSVDIVYNGEPGFTWSCTVQPTGEIV
jgi:hypothetical protein